MAGATPFILTESPKKNHVPLFYWFKYNFLDAFPKFELWMNAKETEEKQHGRQPQTVREVVD